MKIGLFTWPFNDKPLEDVLKFASNLGYEAVEIAVDTGRNNHLNIDKILSGGATEFKSKIKKYGLEISALSSHIDGQLVGGPHTADTDTIIKGTSEKKMKYGTERMKKRLRRRRLWMLMWLMVLLAAKISPDGSFGLVA